MYRYRFIILVLIVILAGAIGVAGGLFLTKQQSRAPAQTQETTEEEKEYLSLPGSGIWFSYPKGWYALYEDARGKGLPKDAPTIIHLTDVDVPVPTSGDKPGTEHIGVSVFSPELFEQYRKKNFLRYYFVPGYESWYARSEGRREWTSVSGYSVTEVVRPVFKNPAGDGPSPTPAILSGIFSVTLKNGFIMSIQSWYAQESGAEDPAHVEARRAALYQKTIDFIQSIQPLDMPRAM